MALRKLIRLITKKNKKTSKILISDAVRITGNETKLFLDYDNNTPSVIDVDEQEIVKWLFDNEEIRKHIIEEIYGIRNLDVLVKLQVKEPLLNKKDQKKIGDIDAVIIPINNPEKTTIIEFKKVKVLTEKDKLVTVNKINTIWKKGFSQIKKLRKFEYHKTYLGIIIEDDARNVNIKNTLNRKSNSNKIKNISEIINNNTLEFKTGMLIARIVQPTGKDFSIRYNFEIFTEKKAQEVNQINETTNRVKELLEKTNDNTLYKQ